MKKSEVEGKLEILNQREIWYDKEIKYLENNPPTKWEAANSRLIKRYKVDRTNLKKSIRNLKNKLKVFKHD